MNYKVKVLTPAFQERVSNWINDKLLGLGNYKRTFEKRRIEGFLHMYWKGELHITVGDPTYSNDEDFQKALKEYYGDIAKPDYVELIVGTSNRGFSTRPRTMWNGESTVLDDIPGIIAYDVTLESALSPINRRMS